MAFPVATTVLTQFLFYGRLVITGTTGLRFQLKYMNYGPYCVVVMIFILYANE